MSERKNPQAFAPEYGEVYENAGGGKYLCDDRNASAESAWMCNTVTGWSFTACGIVRYEDGTIEWDYSRKDGAFYPLDDRKKDLIRRAADREAVRRISRAHVRQKQRSMVNALLCCMI